MARVLKGGAEQVVQHYLETLQTIPNARLVFDPKGDPYVGGAENTRLRRSKIKYHLRRRRHRRRLHRHFDAPQEMRMHAKQIHHIKRPKEVKKEQ